MPCEIVWFPEAVKDVARLREFILKKNPDAAARAARRIKEAVQILADNPEAGKPVDTQGMRLLLSCPALGVGSTRQSLPIIFGGIAPTLPERPPAPPAASSSSNDRRSSGR